VCVFEERLGCFGVGELILVFGYEAVYGNNKPEK
jgi:hypothetical protein